MVVYMTTTKDKYQLPTGVYRYKEELMRKEKITKHTVVKQLYANVENPWIHKIEIDEEEN